MGRSSLDQVFFFEQENILIKQSITDKNRRGGKVNTIFTLGSCQITRS